MSPKNARRTGTICHKCRKKNHFATCCKTKESHGISIKAESKEVEQDFAILEVNRSDRKDWVIPATVQGTEVTLKVDTGSQVNILPVKLFRKIAGVSGTKPDASILRNYSGGVIAHIGTSKLLTRVKEIETVLEFFIVKKCSSAILGLSASKKFGLVNCVDEITGGNQIGYPIATEFPTLFRGIGCVKKMYQMVLKEETTPVIQPTRRVPHMLKLPLKQELERMENACIIVKWKTRRTG